ncbi:MAG: hypothetical protein IKL73_04565 [Lachnospiraceae bacterium]|nr:hypothetical protein [Lachnospiraceae bacterium]
MKKQIMILMLILTMGLTACNSKEEETVEQTQPATTQSPWEILGELLENGMKEATSDDDAVAMTDMKNKTLQEAIDAGYDFNGYSRSGEELVLSFSKVYTDDKINAIKEDLAKLTVSQFAEKYDEEINYNIWGSTHDFSATIGGIHVSFDLDNGTAAVDAHKDESFFDYADATEVKNDKLKNVTVDSVDFLAVLTEDSMKKLNEYEKLSIKLIEENASELKISKLYYQTK